MRVLHGPVNVGNQPWVLSRAERGIGLASDLVLNYPTWLNYPADRILSGYSDKGLLARARRLAFGLSAPFRYDVLHYYFGRSMLTWDDYAPDYQEGHWLYFRDLKMAHGMGRTVVFTLQGCDVRLAARSNAANRTTMCRPNGCSVFELCCTRLDAQRQNFITKYLPLADRVFFLNPELGRFLRSGDFMPYANVALDHVQITLPERRTRPRILHAPSNDSIKGSRQIEAALDALSRNFQFEYIPIRNIPHREAMKLYRSADLVIDQILAGWYGGFAVELMAMGKPVACFIRDEDLSVLPTKMKDEMPLLRLHEDTLIDDLAAILGNQAHWREIGRRGRAYVEHWHNPETIAKALAGIYRDPAMPFKLQPNVC